MLTLVSIGMGEEGRRDLGPLESNQAYKDPKRSTKRLTIAQSDRMTRDKTKCHSITRLILVSISGGRSESTKKG